MKKYLLAVKNPVNEKNLAFRQAVGDHKDHTRIYEFKTKKNRSEFIKDITAIMPDIEYATSEMEEK
jgi:hypothetical protein